jgi:hypothetical protein
MSMLPKEHGAYGQLSFPIVTALLVGGPSLAALSIAVAAVAAFLAHEPFSVLLGLRGVRARRDLAARARVWLAGCVITGVAGAAGAIVFMDPPARLWLAVPLAPAVLLACTTIAGREKSWYGEVAAALSFSGIAVPMAVASGVAPSAALAIAIPFAVLFIASTLAVRVVILRVRGGGVNKAAAQVTRRATFAFSLLTAAGILAGTFPQWWPAWTLIASAPGLLVASFLAAFPPPPTRLRTVGWTLVGLSVATAAIVIAGS